MNPGPSTNSELNLYLESIQGQGRTMLLPALLKVQKLFGYISRDHAQAIGKELKIPAADISGVIEFYSILTTQPTKKKTIGICTSPVCAARGAEKILNHDSTEIDLESVACLGLCDHAPAGLLDGIQIGSLDLEKLYNPMPAPHTKIYSDQPILTKNCNPENPPSLEKYLKNDGFQSLRKAIALSPDEVINIVKESGLKGRGGAGFPTGIKWEGVAKANSTEKYVICNADESEPGTFKDRVLLSGDPFKIIEGMLIAAYAVGSKKGYLYIRAEYPQIQTLMATLIKEANQAGYLGENILGQDFSFQLEIRSGAGAYICGEETALFESIEGKRGFPRIKPPFPTTHGLFGKPTAINNVETFVNIPLIFQISAQAFKQMGSESIPGPRLFSISGDINYPGVYEITKPLTLRELLFKHAGGIPSNKQLRGILMGGAAGKFIDASSLDLLLTEENFRNHGLSLGSGAIMVFDQSRDMKKVIASLGHFFAHESCGKCYPCQIGTQLQSEILDRNLNGGLFQGDISRLKDIGCTMTDASLCGLGQTAAFAVTSALDLWPGLFLEGGTKT